jgi:hypothetical protein
MSTNIPKDFQKAGSLHIHQAKEGNKQLTVGKKISSYYPVKFCRKMAESN